MFFTRNKIVSAATIGIVYSLAFCCVFYFGAKAHAQVALPSSYAITPDGSGNTDLSGTDSAAAATTIEQQQEAQQISDQTGPTSDDVTITTTPENPAAFTSVAIHISSNLIDLNRYNEAWAVDGKIVQNGIGVRDITAETKDYGQSTHVSVAITLPGTVLQKQLVLEPQDVTMTWEAADSYVPPFYQGKKLPSKEGFIKVVAIPNFQQGGGSFDPATGVYIWKRNGNIVSTAGGYGKDFFLFKNNTIRNTEAVTVTASDIADASQATQTINVPIFNPFVLFYEKSTTTGIKSPLATNTIYLTNPSTSTIAEPYFFSTLNSDPAKLGFNWTMNAAPLSISDPTNPETLTLNNPGGQGVATLNLSLNNPTTLFQSANGHLNVVFNKK